MAIAAPQPMATSKAHTTCRICGSTDLYTYLNLGRLPLPNAYLEREQLDEPEFKEEVAIQLCLECGLSQLTRVVDPGRMFETYLYCSSVSAPFREHCAELASTAAKRVHLGPEDTVLDIASNDGCLLREFRRLGHQRVLGIEPAKNLAAAAEDEGLPTINAFWSTELAGVTLRKYKIITALNVLGHVDDLHDFVRGVSFCLAEDGVFVVEVPYVLDFLEQTEFDTAYHEHLTYFGIGQLARLMEMHGLEVEDIQYFHWLHGGTIRAYIGHAGRARTAVRSSFAVVNLPAYQKFALRVEHNKRELRSLLERQRDAGRTVWAYGASAKGTTLLNCIDANSSLVEAVIDDTPAKQGHFIPGAHIEIVGGIERLSPAVDLLLLLAWNFKEELMAKCRAADYHGRFIVPVPKAVIV